MIKRVVNLRIMRRTLSRHAMRNHDLAKYMPSLYKYILRPAKGFCHVNKCRSASCNEQQDENHFWSWACYYLYSTMRGNDSQQEQAGTLAMSLPFLFWKFTFISMYLLCYRIMTLLDYWCIMYGLNNAEDALQQLLKQTMNETHPLTKVQQKDCISARHRIDILVRSRCRPRAPWCPGWCTPWGDPERRRRRHRQPQIFKFGHYMI